MPSDVNGNYSLPAGYLAVTGETIQADQHNPPLEDIAAALTARMLRSGAAPMTGPLQLPDGSASAPALTFSNATNRGLIKTTNGIGIVVGGALVMEITTSGVVGMVPVGTILDFGAHVAPTGWLFCYGQAVSRTTYATLFGIIGGNFGVGDGSTTFNLPDYRGRVTAAPDDMGGVAAGRLDLGATVIGTAGGADAITLSTSQIPAHAHAVDLTATSAGAHQHSGTTAILGSTADNGDAGTNLVTSASEGYVGSTSMTTASGGAHEHDVEGNTANAGGGASHSNVQPTLLMHKIIFAGI